MFGLNRSNNYSKFIDKCEVYSGDILNKDEVKRACKGVDSVIHLAALDQKGCRRDPFLALKVNGFGTKNVLESAKEAGVKRFIYMSTFHVYGKPKGVVTEETKLAPLNDYAITKLVGEYYCRQFWDDLENIIIRLCNSYGTPLGNSGQDLVLYDLCKQSIEKQKIILRTKGRQRRAFVGVSDVVQAIDILARADSKDIKDNIFNVGGNDVLSIRDMAELVAQGYLELYGKKVSIEFEKDAIDEEPVDFNIDMIKIKRLGYEPKTDIKEEVKTMLKVCEDGLIG